MKSNHPLSVAVIVAHPDDETLWAGGTILRNTLWRCFIVCLCRGNDTDRAAKFYKALKILKADGIMGNLDDGPEQKPLNDNEVEQAILELLPQKQFDLIITHSPAGEYTKHLRHEEVGRAGLNLWHKGKISAHELYTFAYEDGNKKYYPKPIENASIFQILETSLWLKKFRIITEIYGFAENSWEAETTPRAEAFWQYSNSYNGK